MSDAIPTRLSCHCGNIRVDVDAPVEKLLQCNCSTCRRFGAVHWYVRPEQVRLLDERRAMSGYVWRALHEVHHFCGACGASIMRTGYPSGVVALNACLIEDVDIFALEVKRYDGRTTIPPGPLP